MPELEKCGEELEDAKRRLTELEKIAGVKQPPREKVKSPEHDSSEDQE